jgi:hypothetical protein
LACNPAKVEVQVRFLARTLVTLEPDGTAAAGKAALQWVRLPPASLIIRLQVQTTSFSDD